LFPLSRKETKAASLLSFHNRAAAIFNNIDKRYKQFYAQKKQNPRGST